VHWNRKELATKRLGIIGTLQFQLEVKLEEPKEALELFILELPVIEMTSTPRGLSGLPLSSRSSSRAEMASSVWPFLVLILERIWSAQYNVSNPIELEEDEEKPVERQAPIHPPNSIADVTVPALKKVDLSLSSRYSRWLSSSHARLFQFRLLLGSVS